MEGQLTSIAYCSDIEELSMCGVGIIIKRQPRREEGGEDGDELVVAGVPEVVSADLDGSIKQGDSITSIAVRKHTPESCGGFPHIPESPTHRPLLGRLVEFFCVYCG
jgi:hypothetical protein